jgi:hypothetical protein
MPQARAPPGVGNRHHQVMTDDLARFIDKAIRAPVHVVGWSDGAIGSCRRAADLVRHSCIGVNVGVAAYVPRVQEITRLPADGRSSTVRVVYSGVADGQALRWCSRR